MGRPSKYTPKLGKKICLAISESDVGLDELQRKYNWFPSGAAIFRWLDRHQAFRKRYACARRVQAQRLAMDQVRIADEASTRTPQHVHKARIRCEARRWAAARLAPMDFGDRLEVRGDQTNPISIQLNSWKDLVNAAKTPEKKEKRKPK